VPDTGPAVCHVNRITVLLSTPCRSANLPSNARPALAARQTPAPVVNPHRQTQGPASAFQAAPSSVLKGLMGAFSSTLPATRDRQSRSRRAAVRGDSIGEVRRWGNRVDADAPPGWREPVWLRVPVRWSRSAVLQCDGTLIASLPERSGVLGFRGRAGCRGRRGACRPDGFRVRFGTGSSPRSKRGGALIPEDRLGGRLLPVVTDLPLSRTALRQGQRTVTPSRAEFQPDGFVRAYIRVPFQPFWRPGDCLSRGLGNLYTHG